MSQKVYGMGAEFADVKALYHAAEKVRDRGFKKWDVHSPFPIHGMDDAMGLKPSIVPWFSFVGGCIGLCLAVGMIYYTSVIDYPLIVQGKPFFAYETSFPIMFELTILLTAFASLGAMFGFNRLPCWHHPVFNWDRLKKVTDDGFFIIIEARDPQYSEHETRQFLESIGGTHVTVIEEEA